MADHNKEAPQDSRKEEGQAAAGQPTQPDESAQSKNTEQVKSEQVAKPKNEQPTIEESGVTQIIRRPDEKENLATGLKAAEEVELYKKILCGPRKYKSGTMSGRYNVDYIPLPEDKSPFKELMPTLAEVQPITRGLLGKDYENSTIYYYALPHMTYGEIGDGTDDVPSFTTQQHLSHISVMHSNIAGMPIEPAEFPLIMSPSPQYTNSYLNDAIGRYSKGALDLRCAVLATDKDKIREVHIYGRVWVPLTKLTVIWKYPSGNWDAVEPTVSSAFSELMGSRLISPKDLLAVSSAFRFAESPSSDVNSRVVHGLREVGACKLSLSRLYWRLWVLFFEASLHEEMGSRLCLHDIAHREPVMEIGSFTQLDLALSLMSRMMQPFFVTETMIHEMIDVDIINVLHVALASSFQGDHYYALMEELPPLEKVKMILPRGYQSQIKGNMTLHSNDVYSTIILLAGMTGQHQLIEEIGRTVSCFLVRPEGDRAWLGHDVITMDLPPIRSAKTLMLHWKMELEECSYVMKPRGPYKYTWIGAIRYLMISLAANAVLSEIGVFTVMQLGVNGLEVPKEWNSKVDMLLSGATEESGLSRLIMRFGLRAQWGMILNKILGSIKIVHKDVMNFARISQWQDWLVLNRQSIEGTFSAAMLSHIVAEKHISLGINYTPRMTGCGTDDSDVFYRMAATNLTNIACRVSNPCNEPIYLENMQSLTGMTGLPLDGQFRMVRITAGMLAWFEFITEDFVAAHEIMTGWHERTKFHWVLCAAKAYYENKFGLCEGESQLISSTFMPSGQDIENAVGQHGHHIRLSDYTNKLEDKGVRFYGSSGRQNSLGSTSDSDEHGVSRTAVYEQEYPIHYCASKDTPTVGDRVLQYGIKTEPLGCGQSSCKAKDTEVIAGRRRVTFPATYKPPKGHEHRSSIPKASRPVPTARRIPNTRMISTLISAYERQNSQTNKPSRDIGPRKVTSRRTEVSEGTKNAEAINNEFYFPTIRSAVDAMRNYGTNLGEDLASTNRLLNIVESVCSLERHAQGATLAAQGRTANVIDRLDELNLHDVLTAVPIGLRAELCRTMVCVMDGLRNHLPDGKSVLDRHHKLSVWFQEALRVLAQVPCMTVEEYEAIGVKVAESLIKNIGIRNVLEEIGWDPVKGKFPVGAEEKASETITKVVDKMESEIVNPSTDTPQDFHAGGSTSPAVSGQRSPGGLDTRKREQDSTPDAPLVGQRPAPSNSTGASASGSLNMSRRSPPASANRAKIPPKRPPGPPPKPMSFRKGD